MFANIVRRGHLTITSAYCHNVFLSISQHPRGFDVCAARPKQPAQAKAACSSARPKQPRIPQAETACHTQPDAGRLSPGPHGGGKGAGSVEDNARLEARATASGLWKRAPAPRRPGAGLQEDARAALRTGVTLRDLDPSPLCLASLPALFTISSRSRSAVVM